MKINSFLIDLFFTHYVLSFALQRAVDCYSVLVNS